MDSGLWRILAFGLVIVVLFGWCSSLTSDLGERAEEAVARSEARAPTRFREAPSTTRTAAGLRAMYAPRTINVRQGPSTSSAIAYKLDPADRTYIGRTRDNGWAAVHGGPASADTVGFVKADLLKRGTPPDLMMMSYTSEYAGRYGSTVIKARIMNTTGRNMRYASVEWEIMNLSGDLIETAFDNIGGIRAGQVWQSEALIHADGQVRYRLGELSGR